jgi:hypothetical protein
LLTPEISSRLKVKDIFSHPWVNSFDKNEIKENERKSQDIIDLNKSDIATTNKRSQDLQNFLNRIKEQTIEKSQLEIKPKHSNKSGSLLEENREKIIENLNYQKLTSLQVAINSTNELSYIEQDKTHSLFDKVLTQVKERNKDKRKRSRIDGTSEIDVESIIKNDVQLNQKIIISNRDKSADSVRKIPSKEYTKNHDGKLLNEIKKIEVDLDNQLLEQRKKFVSFKEMKEDLSNALLAGKIFILNISIFLFLENKPKIIHEGKKQSLIITKIEEIKNKNASIIDSTPTTQSQSQKAIKRNSDKRASGTEQNLVNLHPKTIVNDTTDFQEEFIQNLKEEKDTTASIPDLKHKKPPLNKKSSLGGTSASMNYNEIMYGGKGGRESHKNPKYSSGSRPKDLSRE